MLPQHNIAHSSVRCTPREGPDSTSGGKAAHLMVTVAHLHHIATITPASRPDDVNKTARPHASPFNLTALLAHRLNICMLLTGRCTLSCGSSTVSLMATLPCSTVPVITVPWPLMGKQWSMENSNGAELLRATGCAVLMSSCFSSSTPSGGAPLFASDPAGNSEHA